MSICSFPILSSPYSSRMSSASSIPCLLIIAWDAVMLLSNLIESWRSAVMYSAEYSKLLPGKTLLATDFETAIAILVYYALILLGHNCIQSRWAFKSTGCASSMIFASALCSKGRRVLVSRTGSLAYSVELQLQQHSADCIKPGTEANIVFEWQLDLLPREPWNDLQL